MTGSSRNAPSAARLEGLAVLVGAVLGYAALDASWLLFGLLLLVPDVALVAYLAGPRVGALGYNTIHTYVAPSVLAASAYAHVAPGAWQVCLIWAAHIDMDRLFGLGLKYPSAFRDTHLGTVGRVVSTA